MRQSNSISSPHSHHPEEPQSGVSKDPKPASLETAAAPPPQEQGGEPFRIHIRLAREDDVDGFLAHARAMANFVTPADVVWSAGERRDLFAFAESPSEPFYSTDPARIPEAFVELARLVGLHSDPERFALLYALLCRLQKNPDLLWIDSDPQILLSREFAKSVRRDLHKMKAFVRFRRVVAPDEEEAFIAWFEPEHHIVAAVAPFFVKRFSNMRWSILTPRASAHWDGDELTLGEGAVRSATPTDDELESAWRVYYASIFNPARLKIKAMTAQMPKKYWRHLPEAELIAPLIRDAQSRATQMVAAAPTQPSRYAEAATAKSNAMAVVMPAPDEQPLPALALAEAACTRCPLYAKATQVVPGEGVAHARVMFVGEQPGDQEDLVGKPFVGPAGRLLSTAMERAGVERDKCFVTNAVKHFKFEPRGKRRLHKTPAVGEIDACRYWLDQERLLLQPGLIVALGATAIRGVLGRPEPVSKLRGRFAPLDAQTQFFATVHPSSLLRLQDEEEKRIAWRAFLADLQQVAEWMRTDNARGAAG